MLRVFIAPGAELLILNAARLLLLVLRSGIVPTFTVGTFECDDIAHWKMLLRQENNVEPHTARRACDRD